MRMRRKIRKAMLGLGLAVLVAPVTGVVPAVAATLPVGTVNAVAEQSPTDTRPVKTFSAHCPAGQRVLGGGALTAGGVHAVLTEMQPIHPATGADTFEVTAEADQFGIAGVWSFQAFAFCAVVPTSMQLEIVTKTNPPSSQVSDRVDIQCPQGKQLIGTGGKIENGQGQVDLSMVPNSTGIFAGGSSAIATEDVDGFAGFHTLTGYSVCAVSNQAFDFQLARTFASAPAGQPSLRMTAFCPSGMALTGLAGSAGFGTHLQFIRPDRTGPATSATYVLQAVPAPNVELRMDMSLFCAR